ncbi:MAG: Gfo/Idh/MocA family oxidoreductase [Proteobacteria bacterium]|nr:Gfo/Idh/MocA family oxidoreductase [Pseudomonadota bacterium]
MTDAVPSKILNLGLIGAGVWGRNFIKTIAGLDGARLTRLASRNPESAALVPPDCVISDDWRDLMAAQDLDGVIIATPPALHAEMTLAAIDAGLAVLVEKPMTLSLAEAEAVVSAARAKNAIVLVDHIHLYSAAWEVLKKEARVHGPLQAISAVAGNWGPFRPDTPMLWDWGSHVIAMAMDLVGRRPETAVARSIEIRDVENGKGEALALELGFGDITAKIVISTLYAEKNWLFTASLKGGELVYDDTLDDKLRLKITPQDPGKPVALADGRPLERAVQAFSAAIHRGQADFKDAVLGHDVVGVLEQLQKHLA